jgi:hypothetical protein
MEPICSFETSVDSQRTTQRYIPEEGTLQFFIMWSEFLATDPGVLGSIPGASRFSEKQWVWNGVHSASWGQLRSYLEEIVADPVKKTETNDRGE